MEEKMRVDNSDDRNTTGGIKVARRTINDYNGELRKVQVKGRERNLISSPRRMVCIKPGARGERTWRGGGRRGDTKGLTYIHVYACRLVQVNAPRSALPGVLTAEKRASARPAVTDARNPARWGCGGGKGAKMSATKKRILFLLSLFCTLQRLLGNVPP